MFESLRPFAQQHTFLASSWGEEAQRTISEDGGIAFSSQALTVLGIHALNHNNFDFFKYCMENGGNIQGLSRKEMEAYFLEFEVYKRTFLDCLDPYYNEDIERVQEFIPYYRPYCFRASPSRIETFISMGGKILNPLYRMSFTSKGRGYRKEEGSLLRLNPYDVNTVPLSLWKKVFDEECFHKNGKPRMVQLTQFYLNIFSHLFTRYYIKPSLYSDAKRNVPDLEMTHHFAKNHYHPTGSVICVLKTPPLLHHAWHSEEEKETIFDKIIDKSHLKQLVRIFLDNHQQNLKNTSFKNYTSIPLHKNDDKVMVTMTDRQERLLFAATCHTLKIPFDLSDVNHITKEDLIFFDEFIKQEERSGSFSNYGKHFLYICFFNLMLDYPEKFDCHSSFKEQKMKAYLNTSLNEFPLSFPFLFATAPEDKKQSYLIEYPSDWLVGSVLEKLCEELDFHYSLISYPEFSDEIRDLCLLFDNHPNPHVLFQEKVKELQTIKDFREEPDEDGLYFPSFLMTDTSRKALELRYFCLQYATYRSQILRLIPSMSEQKLASVFKQLSGKYDNHFILQTLHQALLTKHLIAAKGPSIHSSSLDSIRF